MAYNPNETARNDETDFRGVSHEPEYQTIRGVTFPVEPGSSALRLEIDRKKALKRMNADLRTVERFKAQIRASKEQK